jgi:hypothetical protein
MLRFTHFVGLLGIIAFYTKLIKSNHNTENLPLFKKASSGTVANKVVVFSFKNIFSYVHGKRLFETMNV